MYILLAEEQNIKDFDSLFDVVNNISWKKIGGAGNTWYKNNAYSLLAAYTFIDLFKIINN
jgi:hypothetical protein